MDVDIGAEEVCRKENLLPDVEVVQSNRESVGEENEQAVAVGRTTGEEGVGESDVCVKTMSSLSLAAGEKLGEVATPSSILISLNRETHSEPRAPAAKPEQPLKHPKIIQIQAESADTSPIASDNSDSQSNETQRPARSSLKSRRRSKVPKLNLANYQLTIPENQLDQNHRSHSAPNLYGNESPMDMMTSPTTGAKLSNNTEIIAGRLYLGSEVEACSMTYLSKYKITAVITLNDRILSTATVERLKSWMYLPVPDLPGSDMMPIIEQCMKFIDKQQTVLVHCHRGASRSATVVIAYLMYKNGWDFESTFDRVKNCRPEIDPNFGFLNQLQKLEERMAEQRQVANAQTWSWFGMFGRMWR